MLWWMQFFFKEGEGWCNNDCTNTIDYPERNISSTVGEILQIIYWQGSCHQANWCPTLWHSLYHRGIHGAPTTSRWLSTQIWRALRGIPGPNSVSGGEGDGLKVTVWVTWKEYAGYPWIRICQNERMAFFRVMCCSYCCEASWPPDQCWMARRHAARWKICYIQAKLFCCMSSCLLPLHFDQQIAICWVNCYPSY